MWMLIVLGMLIGIIGALVRTLKFALKEHDPILAFLSAIAFEMATSLSFMLLYIMWTSH